MNRKNIPLLLMLIAGAVTCIVMYVRGYSLNAQLVAVFAVLLLFYVLGSILVGTLNYFERQNEEKRGEEGEVIEKDSQDPENAENDPQKQGGT